MQGFHSDDDKRPLPIIMKHVAVTRVYRWRYRRHNRECSGEIWI